MEHQSEDSEMNQHTGYSFDHLKRKTLILDSVIDHNTTTFDVTLVEDFILDKTCDVYLDSFTTFDAQINTTANFMAFLIGFDQLNIKNSTNTAGLKDKLVIPNDATALTTTKVHKGKKYNFLCTVQPTILKQISGTITNLAGLASFPDGDGRFIMELLFVNRD